jgi:iron(III) transport system ATP-binding protein
MSDLLIETATKTYGATRAVDTVSLNVPSGARMAIVGPSGSGKTTLLRLIAGFERPDTGSLRLGDAVLSDDTTFVPPHRRDVGYVAQEGALFPHLSIAGNIAFGMARGIDREARVKELLNQVGLPPDAAERRPHQLSGGQQQRVALARAMARKPKLMLLDEPFSALDAGLREATREMVADVLGETGITTILVTHDQAEALSFGDLLAVMRDGKLVQAGPPEQLYARPSDPQTARFLGEALILNAIVANGMARTILGTVATDAPDGPRTVLVRPEQLRLTPMGPEAAEGSPGRVIGRSYHGSSWRLLIEHVQDTSGSIDGPLETARVFTVSVPAFLAPSIGDEVRIVLTGTAHGFA